MTDVASADGLSTRGDRDDVAGFDLRRTEGADDDDLSDESSDAELDDQIGEFIHARGPALPGSEEREHGSNGHVEHSRSVEQRHVDRPVPYFGPPVQPAQHAVPTPETFEPEAPFAPRVPRAAPTIGLGGNGLRASAGGAGNALPLWPDHVDFDFSTQIVIKRQEEDGKHSYLGKFPKDATLENVLAKWPRAGTYFVFAVDGLGREIDPNNPVRVDIPADHEFLLRKRSAEALGPAGEMLLGRSSGAGGGMAPEVLSLVEKLLAQKDEEAKRLVEETRRREEAIAEREARIQQRDQALALSEIKHIQDATTSLLQQFQGQNNTVVQTILALNQTQMLQAEAAAQRERDRSDALHRQQIEMIAEQNRERASAQEASHRLMFEQMAAINKMHNDVAETRRQEQAASLESEKARLAEERRLQQSFMNAEEKRRQDLAAAKEAITPKSGLDGLRESLEAVNALKELTGGDDDKEDQGILSKGFDMMAEMQRMKHELELEKIRAKSGYPGGMDFDDDEDGEGQVAPRRLAGPVQGQVEIPGPYGQVVQAPQAAPSPFAGLGSPMPTEGLRQAGQGAAPPVLSIVPQGGSPQGGGSPQNGSPFAAPGSASPQGSLSEARQAVQITVDRLAATPDRAQWQNIVGGAIAAVPAMLDLFRAGTIWGAMMDAGADEGLANEVCEMVTATGLAAQNGIPVR